MSSGLRLLRLTRNDVTWFGTTGVDASRLRRASLEEEFEVKKIFVSFSNSAVADFTLCMDSDGSTNGVTINA